MSTSVRKNPNLLPGLVLMHLEFNPKDGLMHAGAVHSASDLNIGPKSHDFINQKLQEICQYMNAHKLSTTRKTAVLPDGFHTVIPTQNQ